MDKTIVCAAFVTPGGMALAFKVVAGSARTLIGTQQLVEASGSGATGACLIIGPVSDPRPCFAVLDRNGGQLHHWHPMDARKPGIEDGSVEETIRALDKLVAHWGYDHDFKEALLAAVDTSLNTIKMLSQAMPTPPVDDTPKDDDAAMAAAAPLVGELLAKHFTH